MTAVINGQWLKSIWFKLLIIENDLSIGLDNNEHVESVALLLRVEKLSLQMKIYFLHWKFI